MDTIVVYKAAPESVSSVLEILRREGFDPIVSEDPGPIAYRRPAGIHLVNILVPGDQADAACVVLKKWDKTRHPEVEKASKQLRGAFICSTAVVVVLAGLMITLGNISNFVPLLFGIWIVVFALIANMERIIKNFTRKD